MALLALTPPASEPIDSTDPVLRQQLRLEDDEVEQDALIDDLAAAARQAVENFTRRRLIDQQVRLLIDGFCERVLLPVAPVQSVAAVAYHDGADWQVLAPSGYQFVQSWQPNCLMAPEGGSWPVTRDAPASVRIDLDVGYGAALADLPPVFGQAIRWLVAHYFFDREAVGDMPKGIEKMLFPVVFWP